MVKQIRALALGAGLLFGAGFAFAQGTEPENPIPQDQTGPGMCPGGCPLCDAHQAGTIALNEGTVITMEEQPNGAVIRFEAPPGDPEAIEAARDAAESYARALQAPQTGRGCPCPHGQEDSMPEEEPLFP